MAINSNRPLNQAVSQPVTQPASQPEASAASAQASAEKPLPLVARTGIVGDRTSLKAGELSKGNPPAILSFAPMPDQARYEQAVGKLEQRVAADVALQDRSVKRSLYLRPNYQSFLLSQPQPSAKGTVIMLHGYTAGPWQYNESAERIHKGGYQVYVPRLPGHGFMKPDGLPSGEKMVDPWNLEEYERFIDETFAEAAALGGPVQVIGLSGGSNLALRMAEKYPQIKGVVAMAPYIGPDNRVPVVNRVVDAIARYTPIDLPRALDFVPYNKNERFANDPALPHTQGSLGNAQAMLSMGTKVRKVDVPVQFITTAGDMLSGTDAVGKLYERSGGAGKHGWYHFPEAEKVPHAMASPRQYDKADALWDKVFETLETGAQHNRKP